MSRPTLDRPIKATEFVYVNAVAITTKADYNIMCKRSLLKDYNFTVL